MQKNQNKRNFYEVLGVKQDASPEEIRTAYQKLARTKHPDKNKNDPNANAEFSEITEAYQTLSDQEKRREYDMMQGAKFGGFEGGGFDGFNFGGFDFQGDIFEEFFRGGSSRKRVNRVEGKHIQKKVRLSLEEAFSGKELNLEVERDERCDTCNGHGFKEGAKQKCTECRGVGYISINAVFTIIRQTCPTCGGTKYVSQVACNGCNGERVKRVRRNLKVQIPCGIEDGQAVRVSGAGGVGLDAPTGDLIVTIEVAPHPIFRRDRGDLYKIQEVRITDLILGGNIKVKDITGAEVKLEVPPGTKVNGKIRIPAHGMRYVNSGSRGSLYLELIPKVPNIRQLPEKVLAAWKVIQEFELGTDFSAELEQEPDVKKK